MLKERITYEDFDQKTVTEDLYFNLTRTEVTENLHIKEDFEKFEKDVDMDGPDRELTVPEIQELLRLVKMVMRLSYGIRSDDGKRFIKGDKVWEEFTQTAAYDAFIFSLFENDGKKANEWMQGIFPKELREAVDANPALAQRPQPMDRQQKQERIKQAEVVQLPEPKEPAKDEAPDFSTMTPEDFANWQASQREQ